MADHDTHDHTGVPGVGTGTTTTTVATDPIWDAAGDLVVGTGANTAARLAVGTNGEVLTLVAGTPSWEAAASGSVATDTIWNAAGDLAVGTGSDTAARLAIGGSGEVLTSNGTTAAWAAAAGGGNYTRLAGFDLGSDTADFDFTSISGSYRALEVFIWGRGTKAAAFDSCRVQFNGDTGGNYDYRDHGSAGSAAQTAQTSGEIGFAVAASGTANYASTFRLWFPYYADTSFFHQYHSAADLPGTQSDFMTGTWKSTSAITRIRLFPAGGNWLTGTRADLYGIT